jgi:hypothetical protein
MLDGKIMMNLFGDEIFLEDCCMYKMWDILNNVRPESK